MMVFLPYRHRAEITKVAKRRENIPVPQGIYYSYDGIKIKLHEILLRLRERFLCRFCTPREIADKAKNTDIELFASLYEDVIYGSKERLDVDAVLEVVKNYV